MVQYLVLTFLNKNMASRILLISRTGLYASELTSWLESRQKPVVGL